MNPKTRLALDTTESMLAFQLSLTSILRPKYWIYWQCREECFRDSIYLEVKSAAPHLTRLQLSDCFFFIAYKNVYMHNEYHPYKIAEKLRLKHCWKQLQQADADFLCKNLSAYFVGNKGFARSYANHALTARQCTTTLNPCDSRSSVRSKLLPGHTLQTSACVQREFERAGIRILRHTPSTKDGNRGPPFVN